MEKRMRVEYKYIVPNSRLDALRAAILPYMQLDAFAERRSNHRYRVRSIYYDTTAFTAYQEKFAGLRMRRKLRIRGYDFPDDDAVAFFEIKSRVDRYGFKQRAQMRWNDLPAFIDRSDPDVSWDGEALPQDERSNLHAFLFHLSRASMRPALLVTYDREAYLGSFDNRMRITLDLDTRCRAYPSLDDLYRDDHLTAILPGRFILEVKFSYSFPPWLSPILDRFHLTRLSISKYGSGIETSGISRRVLPFKTQSTFHTHLHPSIEAFA